MRLYNTEGATQVDDPEYGTLRPDATGAFNGLTDGMYAKLHGRPGWENDAERELRLNKEDLDRVRDPAELLKAVKQLGAGQDAMVQAIATALGLVKAPAEPAPAPVPTPAADPASAPAPILAEPVPEPSAEVPAEAPAPAKPRGRGKAASSASSAAVSE